MAFSLDFARAKAFAFCGGIFRSIGIIGKVHQEIEGD
jgi:hypothetical protein